MSSSWVSRRSFLKLGVAGAAVAGSPFLYSSFKKRKDRLIEAARPGLPIESMEGESGEKFIGDKYARPHAALWQKKIYLEGKGGIPKASETVPLVVIGGGLSGMYASLRLAEHKPVLLEHAPRLGGNSKGETWGDHAYSIGSAYICDPSDDSLSKKLLEELGLMNSFRVEHPEKEETVLGPGGVISSQFWQGSTDPKRAAEFVAAWNVFKDVRENHYPDIPSNSESALDWDALRALDRKSFRQWVKEKFPKLHPHLDEFFEEYCWSACLGHSDELSAAQVLNFLAWDLRGIAVFPGGNAAIAQALAKKLLEKLPAGNVRTSALVVDVALNAEGVRVCYEDAQGDLRTIQAKACVVSSAKFIAKHLLSDVGAPIADQLEAMGKIRYRAYVVANLLLKRKLASPTAAMVRISGAPPAKGTVRPFTDLIFAGWAAGDQGDRTSLTLYRPHALESGRRDLYAEGSFEATRRSIEEGVPELLKALEVSESDVESLRIARWGHAFPLAETGLIADGVVELASRPIANRIFFCQQDNWANPSFEMALSTGAKAAELVGNQLRV